MTTLTLAPDKLKLPTDEPLLEVRNLKTEFKTRAGPLRAVNDVSFRLGGGRVLAVLGESGSGKSVMLRTILGIQAKTARVSGEVIMRGTNLLTLSAKERERIRGDWLSMVFQDPMTALDPVYTVEQQIVETLRRHKRMSRDDAARRARELLELVQIPSPEQRLKSYPFELSGGMRQRVVIAMALACEPSLLLADEPTTALDVTVQARVLDLLRGLQRDLGMSVIIVTHDLAVAAELADDVAVMYAGRIVESGSVRQVIKHPSHPYTRGLLEANVRPGQHDRPEAIPGAPPNLAYLPLGCSFAPRCRHARPECREAFPGERLMEAGHVARCIIAGESVPELEAIAGD
ncbi:MAG: ABC transporter ATP-binding protein [Chloroflexi bacterium]|nr:ABC transporter ATP-binding protein [Chloroflexota bacterium]